MATEPGDPPATANATSKKPEQQRPVFLAADVAHQRGAGGKGSDGGTGDEAGAQNIRRGEEGEALCGIVVHSYI